ncbi:MAG: hypothetical protein AAF467_15600 [Actinomycetota bacterium]
MTEPDDVDDVLRLVDEPLPLRGDREDALLGELLGSLQREPGPAAEIIELHQHPGPARRRVAVAAWVARAAVIVVLAGAVWLAQTGGDGGVANQPDVVTSTPTSMPTPRFATISEACTAFVDAAPDREPIEEAVGVTQQEADQLFEAFDALVDEMTRRPDVDAELTQDLRARRGVLVQLRAEVADGESGWPSFEEFDRSLRLLSEADQRFAGCWPT